MSAALLNLLASSSWSFSKTTLSSQGKKWTTLRRSAPKINLRSSESTKCVDRLVAWSRNSAKNLFKSREYSACNSKNSRTHGTTTCSSTRTRLFNLSKSWRWSKSQKFSLYASVMRCHPASTTAPRSWPSIVPWNRSIFQLKTTMAPPTSSISRMSLKSSKRWLKTRRIRWNWIARSSSWLRSRPLLCLTS